MGMTDEVPRTLAQVSTGAVTGAWGEVREVRGNDAGIEGAGDALHKLSSVAPYQLGENAPAVEVREVQHIDIVPEVSRSSRPLAHAEAPSLSPIACSDLTVSTVRQEAGARALPCEDGCTADTPVYTEPLPICLGCGEPSLHHWRRDDGAHVCDNCWQDMHSANCKSEGRRIIHTYCLKCARLHLNKQVNTCPHCQSGMCITQTESDLRAQERTRAIIEFLYDDPNSEEL